MTAAAPHPDHAHNRGGVLLLHGHGQNGRRMALLARRMRDAGYHTLAPSYHSFSNTMPDIVANLAGPVARFQAGLEGPLHIVTHSLGGLVARALIAAHRQGTLGPKQLGRVVMMGPPHEGSEWADLFHQAGIGGVLGPVAAHLRTQRGPQEEAQFAQVDFELGIIAGDHAIDPILPRLVLPGPNDGKVSVASTIIAGMADHIVLPVPHGFMVANRQVARQVLAFLETGRFKR